MNPTIRRITSAILMALLLTTWYGSETVYAKEKGSDTDLATEIENDPQLTTLAYLIETVGLLDALEGTGPYVLFAPTNAAFDQVSESVRSELIRKENKARLEGLLLYHLYPGKQVALEGSKPQTLAMLNGKEATITKDGKDIKINGSKVQVPGKPLSNGILYKIDQVLKPEG